MKKVEVRIKIRTKAKHVIQAFTRPDMLKDWWAVEKTFIELKDGGLYTLAWNVSETGMAYVSSGIIKKYREDNELIIENFIYLSANRAFLGPMTLTVQATESNGHAETYLCQDGYRTGGDWDWYYKAVKQAWPEVMQHLKSYLEQQNKS